ncbi:MAG: hypothetical protein K2X90_03855 [Candidatus Babeliaceae bacterium]|nr:hypothetical protein [Candidatus Babeliaceae bacterium]
MKSSCKKIVFLFFLVFFVQAHAEINERLVACVGACATGAAVATAGTYFYLQRAYAQQIKTLKDALEKRDLELACEKEKSRLLEQQAERVSRIKGDDKVNKTQDLNYLCGLNGI